MRAGERAEDIYTIFSGWAVRFIVLSNGSRQILSFLIPGDLVPLEILFCPGTAVPFSVKSITPISLCKFRLSDMKKMLFQTEEQMAETCTVLHQYTVATNNRLCDVGRRNAAGRLAQLLLGIEARLKSRNLTRNGTFEFPPRQEDIADALGLTPVHVNRTLMDLRRRKIIEFGRDQMKLLDYNALRNIAEGE